MIVNQIVFRENPDSELVKRAQVLHKQATALKTPHETEINDAYYYTYPDREFNRAVGAGVDRDGVYDSTPVESVKYLITTMIRLLVPQNTPWAIIEWKDKTVARQYATMYREQLADANAVLWEEIKQSNFYLAAYECLIDAVVCGTACLGFYQTRDTLQYLPVPMKSISFTENHCGKVDAVFREHQLSGRQVRERFGDAIPASKMAECDDAGDKQVKLIEAQIPVNNGYKYLISLGGDWSCVSEQFIKYPTYLVWRWEKQSGEVWGESPVRQALPAIKTLNAQVRDFLLVGEWIAKGGWYTGDENMNPEYAAKMMIPGTLLTGIQDELKLIPFSGNFPVTEQMVADQREQVRKLLYNQATTPFRNDKNTYMNEAEVVARKEEFRTSIGQPAERLQMEFLQEAAQAMVGRYQMLGKLPVLSAPQMQAMFGTTKQSDIFKIDINAAVSRSNKIAEAQNNLRAYASAVQMFGPETVNSLINASKLAKEYLQGMGMSNDIFLTDAQVRKAQQLRRVDQGMQAAGAILGGGEAGALAGANLANALPDSTKERLAEQATGLLANQGLQ